MSQWGRSRRFGKGEAAIVAHPHVTMGDDPFEPLKSTGKIDDVLVLNSKGPKDEWEKLAAEVHDCYVGKTYAEWEADEVDPKDRTAVADAIRATLVAKFEAVVGDPLDIIEGSLNEVADAAIRAINYRRIVGE